MVDAAHQESIPAAKEGLQALLSKPQLSGIPVSVMHALWDATERLRFFIVLYACMCVCTVM